MKLTKTQLSNLEKNYSQFQNTGEKYAIVTETGEVIEKYRSKSTAVNDVKRLSLVYIGSNLKIVMI